jgi:hypothetical protein
VAAGHRFFGLALWRAVRAASSAESSGHRILDAVRAIVYAIAAWSTYQEAGRG